MIIWKTIPSYPDYEASDTGQVRRRFPGKRQKEVRALSQHKETSGYLKVGLWVSNRRVSVWAHIVVCEAFHGPKPGPKYDAAHGPLSRNRDDNRAANLRWATRAQNEADKIPDGVTNRGSRNGQSVLTEDDIREIRSAVLPLSSGGRYAKKGSFSGLCDRYGVTRSCVVAIRAYKTWRHI